MWAPVGQRPVIDQHRGYQWVYVYVFVEPATGCSEFLILPTVSIEAMQLALKEFERAVNPGGNDRIVLLMDRAGWHTSPQLRPPSSILPVYFPPYTPELSPAEPLVGVVKRPVANRTLKTIEEVEALLCHECERLMANPQEVRSLTYYPWIRDAIESL